MNDTKEEGEISDEEEAEALGLLAFSFLGTVEIKSVERGFVLSCLG